MGHKYEEGDIVNIKARVECLEDDGEEYYQLSALKASGEPAGGEFIYLNDSELFGKDKNFDKTVKKFKLDEMKKSIQEAEAKVKDAKKEVSNLKAQLKKMEK